MNKSSKFTVSPPENIFKTLLFIVVFFVVLITAYTIFSDGSHIVMYVAVTIFIFIPCLLAMMWAKLFKVTVKDDSISVRKGNGIKYSFNTADIKQVIRRETDSDLSHFGKITIKTINRHFSVDSAMKNFNKMSDYIYNNIDEGKVKVIKKDLVSHK